MIRMNIIQLEIETIRTELMDLGMIIKNVYENGETTGIHAHYPLSNDNHKAITLYLHGDMELQARHGREKFATIRYSKEEMNDWLDIAN